MEEQEHADVEAGVKIAVQKHVDVESLPCLLACLLMMASFWSCF